MYYIYVYLDTRKKGSYQYGDYHFEYEPFYVGKGTNDRYLSHLNIALGHRKGTMNFVVSKSISILNDGFSPEIIKVFDNLLIEEYDKYEIYLIDLIGRSCVDKGPLVNITPGGDGGITWIGEHHNKGKKLEDIVGVERANEIKSNLSKMCSERVGDKNHMYGKTGELSPNFGRKHTEESKEKIREKAIEQFNNYTQLEIDEIIKNMNIARSKVSNDIKQDWYDRTSKTLIDKYDNGELFLPEHRRKLSNNNYKRINKGNECLKISEEQKQKISNSLKNRIFSLEHRNKLRKCVTYDDFEIIIVDLIKNKIIKNITQYRKYVKENKYLKLPISPEKSYINCGWSGWSKYFF